jgi:hypothetical protein
MKVISSIYEFQGCKTQHIEEGVSKFSCRKVINI